MSGHKPFYSSLVIILITPLFIFLINLLLMFWIGPSSIEIYSIDVVLHLFGASSICLAGLGALWHLKRLNIVDDIGLNISYCLVFGLLCFTITLWEIIEYFIGFGSVLLTYNDTISDLVIGLVSGTVTLLILRVLETKWA